MKFQAIVIVPDEDPGALIFEAESIQDAKAYLDRYITSFFPGFWKTADRSFVFSSKNFHYRIELHEVEANA